MTRYNLFNTAEFVIRNQFFEQQDKGEVTLDQIRDSAVAGMDEANLYLDKALNTLYEIKK